MATVSFIPESHQSISAMKAVVDYCLQQKKVADEDSGRRLVGGVNCNGENAFTEFMATKTAHHKKGGMNFYHYVQSFSPSESVTAEQVHEIGLAFAEKACPGHEVLVDDTHRCCASAQPLCHQLRALRKRKQTPPKPRHTDKAVRTQRRYLSAARAERSRTV